MQDTTPHFRFISVLLEKWFSGPRYPGCIEVYTQNFHRVGAGRRPISCLFCFRSLSQKKLKQTNKNLFLTMSMYLFNGICFKYLVFLSVAFLLENIRLLLHDSAAHKNESWMEAAISSPATEISWGVLRKVSGCLNSLQWELISSMLKVEIYVVGKSVLVFFLPNSQWNCWLQAGPTWARASFLLHDTSLLLSLATLSLPHMCSFTQGAEGETYCFALLGQKAFLALISDSIEYGK